MRASTPMMNDKDEEEQAKTQAEAELEQETQPQKQTPNMPPLFEPKIPEEYADLTVDQQPQGAGTGRGKKARTAAVRHPGAAVCVLRAGRVGCCLPCLRGAARTMCCP